MAGQAGKHTVDKEHSVGDLKTRFGKAAGVLFLDYTGLKVSEVESLRRKFRVAKVDYKVVKNTLLARALQGTEAESVTKSLKGTPTGVVIGYDDPVSTAKLVAEFLKETEHLKIKGGILENKGLSAKQAGELSKMSSKRDILAGILGMILAPHRKVAGQIVSAGAKLASQIEKKGTEEKK